MSVGQNPFDSLLASIQSNQAPQPQAAPAPSPGPAASPSPASPLEALPGYADAAQQQAALAQQSTDFIKKHLGRNPRDYMLEAMGIAPEQDANRSTKEKTLHRLGVMAQILGGRNFQQEGQQNYNAAQQQMAQSIGEIKNNQTAQQALASLQAANYYKNLAAQQNQQKLDEAARKNKATEDLKTASQQIQKDLNAGKLTQMQAQQRLNEEKSKYLDATGGLAGLPGLVMTMANETDQGKLGREQAALNAEEAAKRNSKVIQTGTTSTSSQNNGVTSRTSSKQFAPLGPGPTAPLQAAPAPNPAQPGAAPNIAPTPYNATPNSLPPQAATPAPPPGLATGIKNASSPKGRAQVFQRQVASTPDAPGNFRPFDPQHNKVDHYVSLMGSDSASAQKQIAMEKTSSLMPQVTSRMMELGIDPNNITSGQKERSKNADLALEHLDTINKLIDQVNKNGDMGLLASNWNTLINHRLGVDTSKDQLFSKLQTNLGYLTSAMAMAHGGVRGGGSPEMNKKFAELLLAKDAPTMKSKLSAAQDWMKGYKSMVPDPNEVKPKTEAKAAPKAPSSVLDDLYNKYK